MTRPEADNGARGVPPGWFAEPVAVPTGTVKVIGEPETGVIVITLTVAPPPAFGEPPVGIGE